MEVIKNLKTLIDGHNLKIVQGLKSVSFKNTYFIWIWGGSEILIYETKYLTDKEVSVGECSSQDDKLIKHMELKLDHSIVDIFYFDGDNMYVLDVVGVVHSFQISTHQRISPIQFMEVEDIFSSPTYTDSSSKWKENAVTKLEGCDYPISVCMLGAHMVVLAIKDKHLISLVYSFPEFKLMYILDLRKYNSQEAVLSSCTIKYLSPSLKRCFQDDLEILENEIIIIGLTSGLVLWFCADSPVKGPFILCSTYHQVQNLHWIKDENTGLYTHLLIVLSSGPLVVFGQHKNTTLHLPDCVKSSWCLKNYLVTSNLVDCYASELQKNELSLNCISLPVKGVCAMTGIPESDTVLLLATVHGSVYSLNPTATPSGSPSQFIIPDKHLLDNVFLQTQSLENIYEQLSEVDDTLKALSAAVAAKSFPRMFCLSVNVISDTEFSILAKLTESSIIFTQKLWLACVEVIGTNGNREISCHKLQQDFSGENMIELNVTQSLSIGTVVSVELLSFLPNQRPVLVVPLQKIEIDAGLLMVTKALVPSVAPNQESFKEILCSLNNELCNNTVHECKLVVNVPNNFTLNPLLTVLRDSQHRISTDDMNKISDGKKYNLQINIHSIPVQLDLEMKSRELMITCSDVQLCHQVKEAIISRLCSLGDKNINESIALDIQALYQQFEIESLKEGIDFSSLELLRKKLRSSVSFQLPV